MGFVPLKRMSRHIRLDQLGLAASLTPVNSYEIIPSLRNCKRTPLMKMLTFNEAVILKRGPKNKLICATFYIVEENIVLMIVLKAIP